MTAPRNPDALIPAFLEEGISEIPEWYLDAVRRDVRRTRQLVVVGPFRERESFVGIGRIAIGLAAAVVVGIALLNLRPGYGPAGPGPSPTAAGSVTLPPPSTTPPSTTPTGPTEFTSAMYGYTVTMPAGWTISPALLRWDGDGQPGPYAESDSFVGPGELTVWAIAGSFAGDLDAFVQDRIVKNHRDHSDTCPVAVPEVNEPIDIGGKPGTLLGWNCGALINEAVTIRGGVAYEFVFRDLAIEVATDPADRALFESILDSVEFPN
jgi:hypothetical protein